MANSGSEEIEVVWEEPPPAPTKPGMYAEALEEVKKNPGQWARIRVFQSQSSAYGARKMILKQLDGARGWEIRTARIDSSRSAVYAKYQSLEAVS